MLWYIIYAIGLRSTSNPPTLSGNHPIRRAFYRHGKTTAQHWLVAMLVSVAIAMGFSYPTIFLSESPTAGMAAYPHHVWTTAKPFEGDADRTDVEMRQIWVHGSYMKALDKDVLKDALTIQQKLVGNEKLTTIFPGLSEKLRSSTLSWGYHSPLMYWNNSHQMIDADEDVLETINDLSRASSLLDVSLRPASVFAGKKFSRRKLTAADALVITLMNKVDNNVGDDWSARMTLLANGACVNCTIFPHDGHVSRNRVYEFSFTPLSRGEHVLFAFAYGFMALYTILSLRKMRAFHSRFGLVVTAITQMTCSVLAAFTICNILKINLSMIPQNAYPFVVLVIGLENMFRIINAVLAYPATMATELRIANALGDVGPVSVLTAAQNVLILSILARLVSPGVAAFCAFACIATLFDVFFLLTFFVAVLNVDIRRFELQDALSRANRSRHRHRPSPNTHHQSWLDALVHGRLPVSTRMAGTAVTTTFILSLNYHFFEHQGKATSLSELFRLLKKGPPTMSEFDTFAPPPINASLTPGQWMRMQDFDTAKEVMRLAKPGADSFIVRVFAPLIVVLAGADRTDMDVEEAWTTALRNFAIFNFYPVSVAIVFIVAFVAVLMNFLLYTDHADSLFGNDQNEDEEALSLQTVDLPHRLDIVMLAGIEQGHFVSIGLDRSIAIGKYDRTQRRHTIVSLPTGSLAAISWPIHYTAIDENGEWIALHCADDQIWLHKWTSASITGRVLRYPDDNPPLIFRFVRLPCADGSRTYFMVLTSGGRMAFIDMETGRESSARIESAPLVGAKVFETSTQSRRLLAVTDRATIHSYNWIENSWVETAKSNLSIPMTYGRLTGAVRIDCPAELNGTLMVVTSSSLSFLDSQSLNTLSQSEAPLSEAPFDEVVLGPSVQCSACGLSALRSISIVSGREVSSNVDCAITLFTPQPNAENAAICIRKGSDSCQSLDGVQKIHHSISKAGAWSSVASQVILGLRKTVAEGSAKPLANGGLKAGGVGSNLRQRRHARFNAQPAGAQQDSTWEAYSISCEGEMEAIDASPATDEDDHHSSDGGMPQKQQALYVTTPGPAVALDAQSVAVAFGNSVKVIRSTRRGSLIGRKTGRKLDRQPTGEVVNGSAKKE